ncbi:MAG: hypothetical protein QOI02_124 [Actinomycetota bacterium]|nr:hypothetical protein [Actinomycetota bacterium]
MRGVARAGVQVPLPELRTSILLFLGLAIAFGGLHSVLADADWWWAGTGIIFLVFGTALAVRTVLRSRSAGTIAAALVAIAAITLGFGGQTAFLGVIPTVDTWSRFGQIWTHGQESISQQSIPATAGEGITLILCVTIASIAVAMDAMALWLRAPALAGIPLLLVLIVPNVVDPSLADATFFVPVAIIFLLLIRPRIRRSQATAAFGFGAVAVLGALLLPLALPSVVTTNNTQALGGFLTNGINPMIDLGRNLRQSTAMTALTYTSTNFNGEYLRLTTLDTFVGTEWRPDTVRPITGNDIAKIGAAPGLGARVATAKVTSRVTVANSVGQWLPVPYPATSVTGESGDWFWEPDALSVRSTSADMRGQKYTVKSLVVAPTSNQLKDAPSSSGSPLAQVPAGLDPVVAATAEAVTANAKTDYARAVALQDWFRGGDFTYSEKAPVAQGYDGSGLDVIPTFLSTKAGYCVHFASTMALMARTLGIPSRIVVGFLPGTPSTITGRPDIELFTVSSHDLHAWPELYFAGVGWVRFEPTPGRGIVPNFPAAPVDDPSTPNVDESTAVPTPATTTAPPTTAVPGDANNDPQSTAGSSKSGSTAPLGLLALSLVLLVLLVPAATREVIRRRRFGAIRRGECPATQAWTEIAETARDLGYAVSVASTPRDLAEELEYAAALAGPARDAILLLRAGVEGESFSRAESGEATVDSVQLVLHALRAKSSGSQRVRAALLPVTIVDRALAGRLRTS